MLRIHDAFDEMLLRLQIDRSANTCINAKQPKMLPFMPLAMYAVQTGEDILQKGQWWRLGTCCFMHLNIVYTLGYDLCANLNTYSLSFGPPLWGKWISCPFSIY